ncbi:hypothetical protein [Wolbachia endosymbiont (group A) of Ennomos erosarius]|uniref:hypothetical protein n=1 Tax=Wolbachia endosymbiont (group A) of Ennomos erosarius TaxID=3066174 RepID=UPI00333FB9DD
MSFQSGIQEKEWCHPSSLPPLSSQCLTLGSSKLCLQISQYASRFMPKHNWSYMQNRSQCLPPLSSK